MANNGSTMDPGGARAALPALGAGPSAAGFMALCEAYRGGGGIARADGLAQRLEERGGGGGFVELARLIGRRELIAFGWGGSLWLPAFQLDPGDLTVRAGPRRVLLELRPVLDGWNQAVWFVRPNGCLQGCRPIDLIDRAPERTLGAARVERFFTELSIRNPITERRHP